MTSTKPLTAINRGKRGKRRPRYCRPAASLVALLCILVAVAGCHGLKPVELVATPDAPMLIREVSGDKVKVALYDRANTKLVDFGWVHVPVGWTLHKFDWEKRIEEDKGHGR